jgi:hypothetical protein
MIHQPRPQRPTVVAGQVVADHVQVACRVGPLHRPQQALPAGGVARGGGERALLAVADPQRAIHPHPLLAAAVLQGRLDPVPIGRAARRGRGGAGRYRAELVGADDRRALGRVGVERDDPGPFGAKSGSVLLAQERGGRQRTRSPSRIRRT